GALGPNPQARQGRRAGDSVEGHCAVRSMPERYHDEMFPHTLPVFRPATAADVAAIVALVESAYRGESGLRGWTTESHLLDGQRTDAESVAELIARDHSIVLLGERDATLVACCHIEHQG